MKKYILILMNVFLMSFVLNVSAQLYDNQYQQMVSPMDQVEQQHQQKYQDIPIAGEGEDLKTQTDRYQEMTEDINQANQIHFQQNFLNPLGGEVK